MRRLSAWSVILGLALVGSQLAHALAYRLTVPSAASRSELLADTGHGYAAYLPLGFAVVTVLIAAALATEVRLHVRGRRADRPSLWAFGLVAPALFTCQEHFERLAHDGTVPWLAGERTFLAGLALQLPFALAAYLVARLLLRVARSIARVLAPLDPAPLARLASRWPRLDTLLPSTAALALAHPPRGPPSRRG